MERALRYVRPVWRLWDWEYDIPLSEVLHFRLTGKVLYAAKPFAFLRHFIIITCDRAKIYFTERNP